jgi:hypothetical protein
MAGYIGSKAVVVSSGAERKKSFAITTTTTILTGLSYTPNQVHVFHNGVRLVEGTDFTAANGTSLTLNSAAQSGDEVVVVSYATFQVADAVSKSAGGTFDNDLGVNGALTVTGSVVAASGNFNTLVGGRAVVGGTADTITLTTGLGLSALVSGMQIRFRTGGGNTGATTINVDGLGAVTAVTVTSAALPDGYIRSNIDTVITYNAPDWIVSREVERGSSANGNYTRWEDGTQTCWKEYGGSEIVRAQTWTFPAVFISLPAVAPSPCRFIAGGVGEGFGVVVPNGNLATNTTRYLMTAHQLGGTTVANIRYFQLSAIGNWY